MSETKPPKCEHCGGRHEAVTIVHIYDCREAMKAEIARLLEEKAKAEHYGWQLAHDPMPLCGHPRACFQDRNYPESEQNYNPETRSSNPPMEYRCVMCVLQAEIDRLRKENDIWFGRDRDLTQSWSEERQKLQAEIDRLRAAGLGPEWEQLNRQRSVLIDRQIAGTITENEQRTLDALQAEVDAKLGVIMPLPWEKLSELQDKAIQEQRAEINRLRELLKPFAAVAEHCDSQYQSIKFDDDFALVLFGNTRVILPMTGGVFPHLADCRRALEAVRTAQRKDVENG